MIITKEAQEAWVNNYAKDHNGTECFAFVDGINKAIEFIAAKMQQERLESSEKP